MKHILIILALLPFCVSADHLLGGSYPGDTLVWFLQVDTVFGPDSTGIGDEVNIRKIRVTRAQARQILFTIADQQNKSWNARMKLPASLSVANSSWSSRVEQITIVSLLMPCCALSPGNGRCSIRAKTLMLRRMALYLP